MSGTDKLIEKIVEEARVDAEKTVSDARDKADALRRESQARVEEIKAQGEEKASRLETDIVFRAKKNAELDAKREYLAIKHKVIDKAFARALQEMRSMNAADSTELMKKLLFKEAEGGEDIIPSKTHAYIIASVIPEINSMLAKEGKAPVTLKKESEDIPDGFIIRGAGYIKTCTFEELLSDVKEREIGAVCDILF